MGVLLFLAVLQGQAWNIIGGYTGQYSVGHAAYFGVGAYVTVMLLELRHVAPWWGIWAAIAAAMLLSLLIGSITFRLRGPYFVLASIAVAEIIRLAALHFKDLTRGAEGFLLGEIPALHVLGTEIEFFTKRPFYFVGPGAGGAVGAGQLGRPALEARLLLPGHPRGPGRRPLARHQPDPLQERGPGHLGGVHRLRGRLLRHVREVHRSEHRVRPRRLGPDRPHLHHRRHRHHPRPGDRRDGAGAALRGAPQPQGPGADRRPVGRLGVRRPSSSATSRTPTCSSTASWWCW